MTMGIAKLVTMMMTNPLLKASKPSLPLSAVKTPPSTSSTTTLKRTQAGSPTHSSKTRSSKSSKVETRPSTLPVEAVESSYPSTVDDTGATTPKAE